MKNKVIAIVVQEGCGPCHELQKYLVEKEIDYVPIHLGVDIDHWVFSSLFTDGEHAYTPHVMVNGKHVPNLVEYLEVGDL
jgi:glutaredoxin